jgi:hypothetical protein
MEHRISEFDEAPVIWNKTRQMLAYILRTDRRNVPTTWPIPPFDKKILRVFLIPE